MEINNTNNKAPAQFNADNSRIGGLACSIAGAITAAASIAAIVGTVASDRPFSFLPMIINNTSLLILAAAGLLIAATSIWGGMQLKRNIESGYKALVVLWLTLTTICAAGFAVAIVDSLKNIDIIQSWRMAQRLILCFVVTGFCTAALTMTARASAAGSRLRYFTMVVGTIAAAACLLVAVNIIGQLDYLRANVETLGSNKLSDRTTRIVKGVNSPITITCVYTAKDEKKKGSKFASRVMDTIAEMREANDKIQIEDASSLSKRAEVLDRLQKWRDNKAQAQIAFLNDAQKAIPELAKELNAAKEPWENLKEDSYLDQWPMALGEIFKLLSERMTKLQSDIKGRTGASEIIDYNALTADVGQVFVGLEKDISSVSSMLKLFQSIPENIKTNKPAAVKSMDEASKAFEDMLSKLGKEGSEISDPAKVLGQFASAAEATSARMSEAAKELAKIGGQGEAEKMMEFCRPWQAAQDMSGTSISYPELFRKGAENIAEVKTTADQLIRAANADYQKTQIAKFRKMLAILLKEINATKTSAAAAMDKLTAPPDEASKRLLAQIGDDTLWKSLRNTISSLAAQYDALPKVEQDNLDRELREENIVIIEANNKVKVVTFEKVWPLKMKDVMSTSGADEEQARTYNGDSAIATTILSLTQKPFASVVIAYSAPNDEWRYLPIQPGQFKLLTQRLKDANFKVQYWNTADDEGIQDELTEPPQEDPRNPSPKKPKKKSTSKPASQKSDTPQILLVLPSPLMESEPSEKITKMIESGTPAIFLAGALQIDMSYGMSYKYGYADYLKKHWGMDVRYRYRLVSGVRDQVDTKRFRINVVEFSYMPINVFDETCPIGVPLQSQRLMWRDVCPIETVPAMAMPKGVTVQPLMYVPKAWSNYWATGNIRKLISEIGNESLISVDYTSPVNPDLPAPLTVATTAVRSASEDGKTAANRIVVLGTGLSMIDDYLGGKVPEFGSGGALSTTDPPSADADLVVNSAYWAVGMDSYIAAGPAKVMPVRQMSAGLYWTVWGVCLLGLPLGLIAFGTSVVLRRQR